MSYQGYLSLGGVEIVNVPRTLTYARSLLPGLKLEGCGDCDDLGLMLGDGEYASPLVDQPDWFDENNPDTWGFLGFYPLSITGLDDSTRQAPVLESVQDGGFIGRVRHGIREIRVSGLLLANSECSLDVGMQWLKRALDGNGCRDAAGGCEGDDLCFLSCCPEYASGVVDPSSVPVRHPISLVAGWSETSGSWISGAWSNIDSPAEAVGLEIDPPCDDVVFEYRIQPAGLDHLVRFTAQNEQGATVVAAEAVRVRRVNQVYNPSFRNGTTSWLVVASGGVTLTAEPMESRAVMQVSSPQPVDEPAIAVQPGNASLGEVLPAGLRSMSMLVTSTVAACVRGQWVKGADLLYGDPTYLQPGVPTVVKVEGAISPGGAGVEFFMLAPCDGESIPQGTYHISQGMFVQAPTVGPFFDGLTTDVAPYAYRWLGASDGSPSEEAASGVIEVVVPNGSGIIRPEIQMLDGDSLTILEASYLVREEAAPEDCLASYLRTYRKVTTIDGPRVIEEFDSCASMVRVEFTLAAGVPWAYQMLAPMFQVVGDGTTILAADNCPTDDPLAMLNDPDCPLPPPPPRPPVPAGCVVDVSTYVRRVVTIPGDLLMPWQDAVVLVTLDVQTSQAVRQARIRFYPNPLNRTSMNEIDPCSYCGEFIVSYIPAHSSMMIDGMTERAIVTGISDTQVDATHLLYGTDGGPMEWPLLTCGLPYIMTVDTMPTSTDVMTTALELAARG